MRLPFTALFVVVICPNLIAAPPAKIAPGITLTAAKETLRKHGFEVDAKYELAVVARDRDNELEFCPIDSEITLVIEYRASTEKIKSLAIVFISVRAPKMHRDQYFRNVLEIGLEEGGIYTLKLKRESQPANSSK